ncbi:CbrC family protein [Occallatibacter savannae]|uniref:CbrC family protein n=1 Tax=Occallatibacter savannae TaxID=1002691 RepID=UPI0013A53C49|nr:CbrC family protein [Occallatibacter savannae]
MSELLLPTFKYHPDPISSGSIVASGVKCKACNQSRGFMYIGAVYSSHELDDALCPWCIFDGTAHRLFGAEFIDPKAVGDYGRWDAVPGSVMDEVCFRTPSFNGWQQERWFTHCGDAAEFIAPVGSAELQNFDSSLYKAIAEESGFSTDELAQYMKSLDRDSGPTAYAFCCRVCGTWGGYSDTH